MLKARLVQVVSYEVHVGRLWNTPECTDVSKYHRAILVLKKGLSKEEAHSLVHIPDEGDPIRQHPQLNTCERCGAAAPPNASFSAGSSCIYDTASGDLEPGNLFWCDWYPCNERQTCIYGWTNCNGRHLMAVLPNGHHWDIDSRASNCTMPKDTLHRCWVRHGEPPNVHVDKNGLTCAAGAGSIAVTGYHGFLHNGQFT